MSNTPGISPITPDIEEIRHSDEDGFYGDENNGGAGTDRPDEKDPSEDDEIGRRPQEG